MRDQCCHLELMATHWCNNLLDVRDNLQWIVSLSLHWASKKSLATKPLRFAVKYGEEVKWLPVIYFNLYSSTRLFVRLHWLIQAFLLALFCHGICWTTFVRWCFWYFHGACESVCLCVCVALCLLIFLSHWHSFLTSSFFSLLKTKAFRLSFSFTFM